MDPTTPHNSAGIREIAEALDISIGTVDRALHDRAGVSAKTRERVLGKAPALNNQPNLSARSLKLNLRIRIAVFLPIEISCFFNTMREGIRAAALSQGSALVTVAFFDYPRLAEGDIEAIEAADWTTFDEIILAPGSPSRLLQLSRTAAALRKPLVFVGTDAPRLNRLTSVAADALVSRGIAADLLGRIIINKGSVAILTGAMSIHDHTEKLRGFAASLATLAPHLTLLPAIESHEYPAEAYFCYRTPSKLEPQSPWSVHKHCEQFPCVASHQGEMQRRKVGCHRHRFISRAHVSYRGRRRRSISISTTVHTGSARAGSPYRFSS